MKVRPTKEQVQARVDEILGIWLDGAQSWDFVQYVRDKEREEGSLWYVTEGHEPLSYCQIRRYVMKAEARIAATCKANREKLFRQHLVQRRHLYAKALSQGDIRTALAVKDSEAKLLTQWGVFPEAEADKTKRTAAGSIVLNVVEQLVVRQEPPTLPLVIEEAREHVNGHGSADRNAGPAPDGAAASRPAGLPPV
jgi:hypothetical protein